jgi:hypothetical protein
VQSACGSNLNLIDLDFVPCWNLKRLVHQLASSLPHGGTAIVLLTTKAQDLSIFDFRFAIATHFFQPPRTTVPFTTSLSAVLALLGAQGDSFSVDGVDDISMQFSNALFGTADTLPNDPDIRTGFIARNSVLGWRKECLRGVWEGALLKAGLLVKMEDKS